MWQIFYLAETVKKSAKKGLATACGKSIGVTKHDITNYKTWMELKPN